MVKEIEIQALPAELHLHENHREKLAAKLGVDLERIQGAKLLRSSVDSRKRQPRFMLLYRVWVDEAVTEDPGWAPRYKDVRSSEPVVIVGSGPAGLFAALRLLELGLRPVLLERGKDVRNRRHDIAKLSKFAELDAESNYCFGEGGAGTFSDGKLYTRSKKRGSVNSLLARLVHHGASSRILVDAHPHIGSNKLPQLVSKLTETIRGFGGEVLFSERLVEIERDSAGVCGVRTAGGLHIKCRALILATGHSARDIFTLLANMGLTLEAKPFALGVRVEHPQTHIDELMYGTSPRHENLPAAPYSLRTQADQRGVFSFCMCPGGIICPAATAEGEIVVNGWSPSKRNSFHANSGIVIEVSVEDLKAEPVEPVFAALSIQRRHERRAYELGGGKLVAPAQRLTDLLRGRVSSTLPRCSYKPGLSSALLKDVFDAAIFSRMCEGFRQFERQYPGYITEEAVAVAAETRTSSPVRVPRVSTTRMHPDMEGLFPCGEGAGYAGGIMSAAIDGEQTAEAVGSFLDKRGMG